MLPSLITYLPKFGLFFKKNQSILKKMTAGCLEVVERLPPDTNGHS